MGSHTSGGLSSHTRAEDSLGDLFPVTLQTEASSASLANWGRTPAQGVYQGGVRDWALFFNFPISARYFSPSVRPSV